MKYERFNGKSWNFSTKDWTFYRKMMAIAGGEVSSERFQRLIEALILYAYENDLGAIRNAFHQANMEDK